MKLMVLRMRQCKRRGASLRKIDIEKYLMLACIITFSLLIIMQIALISPSVRTFLNTGSGLEGAPLGSEEYLYKQGEIVLGLASGDTDSRIKVLVNGQETASFITRYAKLNVKEGDVIEISAASNDNREIELISKSNNIVTDRLGSIYKIQQGIKKIMKVQMD